jgi:hypothetical protein
VKPARSSNRDSNKVACRQMSILGADARKKNKCYVVETRQLNGTSELTGKKATPREKGRGPFRISAAPDAR